jgi:hypothetical protein
MTDPVGISQYGYAANVSELAAAAGEGGQYGATPSPVGAMIPWGERLYDDSREGRMRTVPIDWAANQVYSMSSEQYGFLGQMMQIFNNTSSAYDRAAIQYEYINKIVPGTAAYNQATGSELTPFEFALMRNGDSPMPVDKSQGSGGYSRVIDLTNPSDAKVLADSALSDYLGRAANEEETSMFLSTLNKVERQNPIITTQSSRSGGVNREQVAKEFAQSQEGAAEYLASTQYMDWFMEKVASDPTEGIESGL